MNWFVKFLLKRELRKKLSNNSLYTCQIAEDIYEVVRDAFDKKYAGDDVNKKIDSFLYDQFWRTQKFFPKPILRMENYSSLRRAEFVTIAERIAKKAHHGQLRNDGKTPYYFHIEGTVSRVYNESDEVVAAAYLHDVLEDTRMTADDLKHAGIPEHVVKTVVILTKVKGEYYDKYLQRVRNDYTASKVKVADILQNYNDNPTEKQKAKYEKALMYILS